MPLTNVFPAFPPVSVDELIEHLRLDFNPEDQPESEQYLLLQTYLAAAIEHVRNRTNSEPGVAARYRLTTAVAGAETTLPLPPLISVDEVKSDGQVLAADQYKVDASRPAKLTVNAPIGSVLEVTFTAGFPSVSVVPTTLKVAILCVAGHLFENREATNVVELKPNPYVEALLVPHTFYPFGEVL